MSVKPREGTGTNPLKYGPIKSISVGNIYLRRRYDGPVDSYQEHDIERYCTMQGSLLRPKTSETRIQSRAVPTFHTLRVGGAHVSIIHACRYMYKCSYIN